MCYNHMLFLFWIYAVLAMSAYMLYACLRRNKGQIIDLNNPNCCLNVEVLKTTWLIAAWKKSKFILEHYIAEWLDSR